MTSLLIGSNAAANNAPISVKSDMELEEEDIEKFQQDMVATQQKLADDAKARLDAARVWNEQNHLDREKKAADDRAKKAKEAEEVRKVEEAWKAEAQKM